MALLQRTPLIRVAAVLDGAGRVFPGAALLRTAAVAATALGTLHTLAGATMLVSTQPSPLTVTAGRAIDAIALSSAGTTSPPNSWRITGSFPPGLSFQGGVTLGIVNATTLFLTGTPTTAGTYKFTLQAGEYVNLGGLNTPAFNYTIVVTGAAVPAPRFTTQPADQSIAVGGSVTFTSAATDAQSYQWKRNGAAIVGATNGILSIAAVKLTDAGSYSVVATNASGTVTSDPAVLTVRAAATAPAILMSPADQIVTAGATVMFVAVASGTPAPTFQWQRNGVALAGATDAMLVLANVQPGDAGAYALVATNAAGSAISATAILQIAETSGPSQSRLVNLSVRTVGGTGDRVLILGVTLGGTGTLGARPVFVRGVGPSLSAFGLTGVIADPALTIFRGGTAVGGNDDWAGDPEVVGVAARVGAFPLASATSRDAALLTRFETGGYSIQLAPSMRGDSARESGIALAELYDTAPLDADTGTAPRFVNLSARAQVGIGADVLIAGFVIAGNGSKTLLVRAVGPTLAGFGVAGTLADPKLELRAQGGLLRANDDWGGTAELTSAFASVGAFPLTDARSRDAAFVVTLPPGAYTVQVSGVGDTTGVALVELYELR